MAAATIVKQVLQNGQRNYVALFTSIFGAGDTISGYLALDPTSGGDMGVAFAGQTLYPGAHLKLMELRYDLSEGMSLELTWDATSAQPAYIIDGLGTGQQKFWKAGGLTTSGIAGATGKVLFNLLGTPTANQTMSLYIIARKDISQ